MSAFGDITCPYCGVSYCELDEHECEVYVMKYRIEKQDETIEQLQAVFDAAKGLCFGEDWNNGTHAMIYKQKLRDAVAAIPQPPEEEVHWSPGDEI